MINWYKLAQSLFESKYYMDPQGNLYGGMIHQDIIFDLIDSHNLRQHGIDEQLVRGGSLLKLYDKLRKLGWLRISLSKDRIYVDVYGIPENINNLETALFKVPKSIKRVIMEDKMHSNTVEFKLKDFIESGEGLREYLGRYGV
jgi:hypothetical protein